jgi:hypothetical protein
MTAGYLYDKSYHQGFDKWHAGIDFGAPAGTPVKTLVGGTVAWTWYGASEGGFVAINGDDGKQWVYGHLQGIGGFQAGQKVEPGQTIGNIGNQSGAKHLHLEIKTAGQLTGGAHPDQNSVRNVTMSPLQAYWQLKNRNGGSSTLSGEANFTEALAFVLGVEGGYGNDPYDLGGPTNMGVTQDTYDTYQQRKGLPLKDVKLITREEAVDIYDTMYWKASGSDQLPGKLAIIHFDAAVNHGVGKANQLLEQARQSSNRDEMSIIRKYLEIREDYYYAIVASNPAQQRFLQGWLNRLTRLRNKVGA